MYEKIGSNDKFLFGDISDDDFWAAISADIDDYDFHAYDPSYFAGDTLILGRILSFKKGIIEIWGRSLNGFRQVINTKSEEKTNEDNRIFYNREQRILAE